MSTSELKEKLIGKISGTDDEVLLLEVYRLLELEGGDTALYHLTDEQISVLNESQSEIRKGKFLTDHDANKEIDEWLGK